MNSFEEKLLYPQPGSRVDAAHAYGIDLTLLIERLRLTPEERVRDLQRAIRGLEAMRSKAHRQRTPAPAIQTSATQKERT